MCVDIRCFVCALVVVAVPGRSAGALGLRVSVVGVYTIRLDGQLSFLWLSTIHLLTVSFARPALNMCLRFRIVVTAGSHFGNVRLLILGF